MSEQEYALCPHCSLVNAIRHGAIYCRNCGKNSGALGLPRIPRVDDDVEPVSVDDNFDQYYLIAKCKHCRGLNVVENDQINCHCGVTTEAWAFKAQLFKQIPSMSRRDPEVDMEIGSAGVLHGSKEPEFEISPQGAQVLKHEEIRQSVYDNFAFHQSDTVIFAKSHNDMRERCKELALYIVEEVPDGRDQALALTKLEEVMYWANAGISKGSNIHY